MKATTKVQRTDREIVNFSARYYRFFEEIEMKTVGGVRTPQGTRRVWNLNWN
jgi:hypothetical protein